MKHVIWSLLFLFVFSDLAVAHEAQRPSLICEFLLEQKPYREASLSHAQSLIENFRDKTLLPNSLPGSAFAEVREFLGLNSRGAYGPITFMVRRSESEIDSYELVVRKGDKILNKIVLRPPRTAVWKKMTAADLSGNFAFDWTLEREDVSDLTVGWSMPRNNGRHFFVSLQETTEGKLRLALGLDLNPEYENQARYGKPDPNGPFVLGYRNQRFRRIEAYSIELDLQK